MMDGVGEGQQPAASSSTGGDEVPRSKHGPVLRGAVERTPYAMEREGEITTVSAGPCPLRVLSLCGVGTLNGDSWSWQPGLTSRMAAHLLSRYYLPNGTG